MQDDPWPKTRLNRFIEYFIRVGFALKHGKSFRSTILLYYLTQFKRGLVYRNLTRYAPEKIHQISFRAATGKRWDVYVRDNGQDAQMLVEFFRYNLLGRLRKLDTKPKVIYDLGANIGIASLALAAQCPKARIYGFEPIPANYEICLRNYLNLTNAQALGCAVGGSSGKTSFEISNDPRGGHLAGNSFPKSADSNRKIEVAVWTIADLIEAKGLARPDFLKVDVEGAELEVLHGLGVYSKAVKHMYIETHSTGLHNDCISWLQLNGFCIEEELRYTSDLGGLWATRCDRIRA